MAASNIATSTPYSGSGTEAAGLIVYVDENTGGLRSSKPPGAVQGNDAHIAKADRVRLTSRVLIGVTVPLRLVKSIGEKSTAKPLGVPLSIVIVVVSDVGV
jgi:hypothetical protein